MDGEQETSNARRERTIIAIPDYFICFLTGKIMADPVFVSSGNTYDRSAILEYFQSQGPNDPKTSKHVNPEFLVENLHLKQSIQDFKTANPTLNTEPNKKTSESQGNDEVNLLKQLLT